MARGRSGIGGRSDLIELILGECFGVRPQGVEVEHQSLATRNGVCALRSCERDHVTPCGA